MAAYIRLAASAALFCFSLAQEVRSEATPQDLPAKITRASIFYQPLMWVGQKAPDALESEALWAEIEKIPKAGIDPSLPALEKFITAHPDSPWTPSLRANLARYYREHGLYTRALDHWRAA